MVVLRRTRCGANCAVCAGTSSLHRHAQPVAGTAPARSRLDRHVVVGDGLSHLLATRAKANQGGATMGDVTIASTCRPQPPQREGVSKKQGVLFSSSPGRVLISLSEVINFVVLVTFAVVAMFVFQTIMLLGKCRPTESTHTPPAAS